MRSHRFALILTGVLAFLTALAAVFYLHSRTPSIEGSIRLESPSGEVSISLASLETQPVRGERKNGKGETIPVEGRGFPLQDLVRSAGIDPRDVSQVDVTADDGYYATLSGEELAQADKAFLLLEDEGARLVVFGDENSKRSVSHVVSVTLRDGR